MLLRVSSALHNIYIFHTPMTLYSLFVVKMPLNTKQTNILGLIRFLIQIQQFLPEFHHCRIESIVKLSWISCLGGIAVFSFILYILSVSRDSVVNGPNLYLMHLSLWVWWPFSLCYCTKISNFWTTTMCNNADIWKWQKSWNNTVLVINYS